MSKLDEIEKRRAQVPAALHAIHDPDAPDFFAMSEPWGALPEGDPQSSTLSPQPDRHGWNNDSGFSGYGLPQQVAEALAAMPQDVDWLIARVRELETELAEALRSNR